MPLGLVFDDGVLIDERRGTTWTKGWGALEPPLVSVHKDSKTSKSTFNWPRKITMLAN